ncbi:MAG TPA: putative toxin-antitoxin system toxin component, PIN family [Tepidisphaeraceae bacterium]|jgi:putative PIN family toxin of toxin-antitoxin system|nr:putative toxin-antitoxin system toxin component, PIN family [Tepidisphaeraceae bacterium]
MSSTPVRVVYDCVVFLQGVGRRGNAARKCLDLVDDGTVQLCLSADVLAEIEDVLHRPEIRRKFPLIESANSKTLLRTARNKAMLLADVPKAFQLPRDPDDEPYTDLAIAADAKFLVTWNDRHLTYLMRQETPEGVEFCRRFPSVKIVDPPTFLAEIRRLATSA